MFCYEVWDLPLREMHTEDGQALESKYSTSYDGYEDKHSELRVFPPGVGLYRKEVYQRIHTYSKKSFSHTSDMLNAFLGILAAFEAGPLGLRNCFGTPIFPNPNVSETTAMEKMYPIAGFLKGLGWELSECGKRQQNLPSWSWMGWVGSEITDKLIEREKWHLPTQKPQVKIGIELSDGIVLGWDLFQARYAEVNIPSKLSGYLYVSAWTIPLRMRERDGLRQNCEFDMNDGCYIVWNFPPHQDRDLSKAKLLEPDRHYERIVNKGERLAFNGDDLVEAGDSKSQYSSEGWVTEGEDASGEGYMSDGEREESVLEDYPPEPLDNNKSLSDSSCYGLIIGENRSRSGYKDLFIMVVAEVDGRVERVGSDWTVFRLSLHSPEGVSMGSEIANGSKAIKKRYGKRWWLNAKSTYQTWRIGQLKWTLFFDMPNPAGAPSWSSGQSCVLLQTWPLHFTISMRILILPMKSGLRPEISKTRSCHSLRLLIVLANHTTSAGRARIKPSKSMYLWKRAENSQLSTATRPCAPGRLTIIFMLAPSIYG